MLGTPRWRFVTEVLVPAAAPMIFTGLRLSLQAAWTTLVAAELVGALVGLGLVLNMAQQDIYPGMILVGMLTVGVLGFFTTWVLGGRGAPSAGLEHGGKGLSDDRPAAQTAGDDGIWAHRP